MQPRAIRLSDETRKAVDEAAKERGFTSASAFIRYAVEQELAGRQEEVTGAEERLVGKIERVEREPLRLVRMLLALFAYLDTPTKTFLTCVPEPPSDAKVPGCGSGKGTLRPLTEERRLRDGRRVETDDARVGG